MIDNIKEYLTVTRGRNNFKESQDDVIELLIEKFGSILEKNGINVVVIWSTLAKNEIIINEDKSKTIIWDTNYWTHCACYYSNLVLLDQHVKEKSELVDIQCDALWRDLFKVIISRSDDYSTKAKMLLTKYYLSYGTRSYQLELDKETSAQNIVNQLKDVATAKVYVFLHEIAHITAVGELDYYINILKSAFCDELKESTFYQVCDADSSLGTKEKKYLENILNNFITDINNGIYKPAEEIIADMRALQSMCNSFMLRFPKEIPDGFLNYQGGIALARSFNLRIKFIDKVIHSFFDSSNPQSFEELLYDSDFGKKFVLRDRLSEVLQPLIIVSCFGKRCNKAFLLKYETQFQFSRDTIKAVDSAVAQHLEKIRIRIENESERFAKSEFELQIDDMLEYLLYYPTEEQDNDVVNNPTKYYGCTGLLF